MLAEIVVSLSSKGEANTVGLSLFTLLVSNLLS